MIALFLLVPVAFIAFLCVAYVAFLVLDEPVEGQPKKHTYPVKYKY